LAWDYGMWLGILASIGMKHEIVRPAAWKRSMQVSKDKGQARVKATQLWPDMADKLKLVKHHGRAEALLLAEWLRRTAA